MRSLAKNTKSNMLIEQFIPDNVFLYVAKGAVRFFDGNKNYLLNAGECGIARKNRLSKFSLPEHHDRFEPIIFCFDEPFLKEFLQKHKLHITQPETNDTYIKIRESELITNFIQSIKPYYKGVMELDKAFEDVKYEELLIILLQIHPELAGILFDFGIPEKINLEAFMNSNFQFNVSVKRLAFLTGRSISAFKRDFKTIFNDTPSRWLVKKRLAEAYFKIDKQTQKPSDIYVDLGFESLSHFSTAFKRQFGITPTQLGARNTKPLF